MTTSFAKQVTYEKMPNGTEMFLLKTSVSGLVKCHIALPGGHYATYNKKTIAAFLSELLPGATKKKVREKVLEHFESLGAQVSVHAAAKHLMVTLVVRKEVFEDALQLLAEVLITPSFTQQAFRETKHRIENVLRNSREDTQSQAHIELMRTLFRKGHPHWSPKTEAVLQELKTVQLQDVRTFYRDTLSAVGALVCVVGDINVKQARAAVRNSFEQLPAKRPTAAGLLHADRTKISHDADIVLPMHDKMNVSTLFAIPLSITKDHSDFYALQTAVHVLGGASTSHLFHTLRTKMSLTYGAYATLEGLADGYPGYLSARAIFPHDVFVKGREAMRNVIKNFIRKGVTARELKTHKEMVAGTYAVGLSSTAGIAQAIFATLLSGRPISRLDEYPDIINALTLREVNSAIEEHLDYDLAVTTAAGSVTKKGAPLQRKS